VIEAQQQSVFLSRSMRTWFCGYWKEWIVRHSQQKKVLSGGISVRQPKFEVDGTMSKAKRLKCDFGDSRLTKRDNLPFQAYLDKTVIGYHLLLRYLD
jgi:hypothetical protein